VRPDCKTASGDSGAVSVLSFVQLRDPDNTIPFPLFRADRVLAGADFDLESVRVAKNGEPLIRRGVRPIRAVHGRHRHGAGLVA
jgi:hypothetical protein